MADKMTIRDQSRGPHPEGQYVAVCVDFIALGPNVEQFGDDPPVILEKVAFVFLTCSKRNGQPLQISREFAVSLGPKSSLRGFLEAWAGRHYGDREIKQEGIALDALVHTGALLTISHKESRSHNTYGVVGAIEPLPVARAGEVPSTHGYQRARFWQKRKEEYAAKVARFQKEHSSDFVLPPEDEADDDLPF